MKDKDIKELLDMLGLNEIDKYSLEYDILILAVLPLSNFSSYQNALLYHQRMTYKIAQGDSIFHLF